MTANNEIKCMWMWSWFKLEYYSGIFLERLRKVTKRLTQYSQCHVEQEPSEYKSGS